LYFNLVASLALVLWPLAACTTAVYAHVQMLDTYSDHSFRLMALAVGTIPHVATLAVYQMSLGQIEAHAGKLQLLGIIVLSNPIKADSKDTVAELQDSYQHNMSEEEMIGDRA
jgi:magnesium-transporting ATPase (P-type)